MSTNSDCNTCEVNQTSQHSSKTINLLLVDGVIYKVINQPIKIKPCWNQNNCYYHNMGICHFCHFNRITSTDISILFDVLNINSLLCANMREFQKTHSTKTDEIDKLNLSLIEAKQKIESLESLATQLANDNLNLDSRVDELIEFNQTKIDKIDKLEKIDHNCGNKE